MLALVFTAFAWDLSEAAVFEDGTYFRYGALLNDGGAPRVALSTNDDLTIRDPRTNAVLATWENGGTNVAWMPDGSGVVYCAIGGTYALSWDGTTLGTPVEISLAGCGAAITGSTEVAISQGGYIAWANLTTVTPSALIGPEGLALDGDRLLVAEGTEVLDLNGTVYDFGFEVSGLAWALDTVWTNRQIEGGIRSALGHELDDGVPQGADLDGDGTPDLVAMGQGGFDTIVIDSLTGIPRAMPGVVGGQISTASLGEDCHAMVVVNPDGYRYYTPVACRGDADADGYTTEQGDCNDSDPDLNPGVVEICDEIDHNCDGRTLDVVIDPVAPITANEGEFFQVPVELCDTPQLSLDACDSDNSGIFCRFDDDYSGDLEVFLFGAEDHGITVELTIENVAPQLASGFVVFRPGVDGQVDTLVVDDPSETDTHTFELLDGPNWFTLTSNGTATADAPRQEGSHEAQIRITDDDGGVTETILAIEIRVPSAPQQGCVECSVTGMLPVGMLGWVGLLLVRRRMR